jgi:hypothetical protein
MNDDQIENLVKQAHQIFGKISIYEVIDLDRESAAKILTEHYGPTDEQQMEKYFSILDQLRE